MTPEEIARFAARHIGNPVTLYNNYTRETITGTIDEVQNGRFLWIRRDGGGRTITGLPTKQVMPRRVGRDVIFESTEKVMDGLVTYRLTISV